MAVSICLYTSVFGGELSNSKRAYWVLFRDKEQQQSINLSDRTLEKRSRLAEYSDYLWYDVPVNEAYVDSIRDMGIQIRQISRWLNGVSATVEESQLARIEKLEFVIGIRPVSSYSRERAMPDEYGDMRRGKASVFDYGGSYGQNSMLGIDSLHNLGYSGSGLMIGIMDTGFDTSHAAFADIRADGRITATRDFINNDFDVMDGPDFQRTHGTQVFSALGGFEQGYLVGPAFGAAFVLAKTEIVLQEIQAEEDNWVAAAEWMDSLGVDIISSSLGYLDWYDTTQLDGRTALVTQAANAAVSLGIIVVNAAGNEGNTPWRKIIPPSDGDSVIAVGAVDPGGAIIDFSSRGPTADGRIKPDFCAQGSMVVLANWSGGYGFSSGTSFATPQIAGGIALLMEARPDWVLADIIAALKSSSSSSFLPNNSYGWGIPNFTTAYHRGSFQISGSGLAVLIAPHPAIDSAVFYLTSSGAGQGMVSIFDISGIPVRTMMVSSTGREIITLVWDGENDSNRKVSTGVYICLFEMNGSSVRRKLFLVSNR